MELPIRTTEDAPEDSRPVLEGIGQAYGFVPNVLAVLANAPAALKGYTALSKLFSETSLSATEREIVLITVSIENGCEYCVAAHSVIAGLGNVPADVIHALRSGEPLSDPKLEALRRFAKGLVAARGWPAEDLTRAFLDAGYTSAQALEVLLGVTMKTLSNYTNHLAETPLDEAFAPAEWAKAD